MSRSVNLLLLPALLFLGSACSKKAVVKESASPSAPGAPEEPAASGLPGAGDVQTAMANKDYSSAVERLTVLKTLAVSPEQLNEYSSLFSDVRGKLLDLAPTDPKAAEALATLRMMRSGR